MKKTIVIFGVLLLALLAGCTGQESTPMVAVQGLTPIRLPMGYIPTVQYAPLYVAQERGYFGEAGFEVTFDYSTETDGIALVGQGEQPFSLASGEQVLLAREQGIPVVYVLAWYQDYPVAVVAKADSGIKGPADLVGKRVGLPGLYGANYIGLIAMLHSQGISESELTLDSIGYNQVEALATDQEQAVVGYSTNEPVQLAAQGYDINTFEVAQFVHLAANGLVTNETMIADHPEAVRKFVQAVIKGIQDTLADPDAAYQICTKYVQGLDAQDDSVQREVLARSMGFWKADKIGYIQPAAWQNMQQVLLEMGLLQSPLDLNAAYTNDFIQ